jgi:hypothetical protein
MIESKGRSLTFTRMPLAANFHFSFETEQSCAFLMLVETMSCYESYDGGLVFGEKKNQSTGIMGDRVGLGINNQPFVFSSSGNH